MQEKHLPDPRRAGHVKRYHTYPTLRQQDVAAHSWQTIRILLAIYPDCPRHLLIYGLVHDGGEWKNGDLPFETKLNKSEAWKKETKTAEEDANRAMCLPWSWPPQPALTNEENASFKLAELIEMMEFGLEEMNLGNKYASLIVERTQRAAYKACNETSEVPPLVRAAALKYMSKRLKVEGEINEHGPYVIFGANRPERLDELERERAYISRLVEKERGTERMVYAEKEDRPAPSDDGTTV